MAFLAGLKSAVLTTAFVVLAAEGVASTPHNNTGAHDGKMRLMDDRPNFPFDPNTIESCAWWWDHNGEIPCEEMPAEWGITMEEFLSWVSSNSVHPTLHGLKIDTMARIPPSHPAARTSTSVGPTVSRLRLWRRR